MKKLNITFILLILFSISYAQVSIKDFEMLKETVTTLQSNDSQLRKDFATQKQQIEILQKNLKLQNTTIDSLKKVVTLNTQNISTTANDLGIKIEQTETNASKQFESVNQTISQNTLYWIIAILAVLLLLAVVFILLRKQIFKQKTDIYQTIETTKSSLEQEAVKLDEKLINLLETQFKISAANSKSENKDPDHSLALRVADELTRIKKNMTQMDEKTKGLKQLSKSVELIQNEFAANGYEIVEMLGKSYAETMKATANFIPDETLKSGERIITRIIKPQVNYKGVMIQPAQVEVSQGD
jgi:hypothetical protein